MFLDHEKAFNCITREAMRDALRELEVSAKLINVMKSTYQYSYSGVVGSDRMFEAGTSVRHGCVLSPVFNLVHEHVSCRDVRTFRGHSILHMQMKLHWLQISKKDYNRLCRNEMSRLKGMV